VDDEQRKTRGCKVEEEEDHGGVGCNKISKRRAILYTTSFYSLSFTRLYYTRTNRNFLPAGTRKIKVAYPPPPPPPPP
jgi:hypothetical protein